MDNDKAKNLNSTYLVSDDGGSSGITLPGTNTATHNTGLSPFFMERSGYTLGWISVNIERVAERRGSDGFLWSANVKSGSDAYRIMISVQSALPIHSGNRIYSNSLRCLVSTNNG